MSRLIDADKIDFNEVFGGQSDFAKDTRGAAQSLIDAQPTVEAVPKTYADQIRWERDIAVKQLNEIGCQFGQKMDEVKKKLEAVPVVYGEWIHVPSSDMATGQAYECSNCKKLRYGSFLPPFCQMCGADMRKKV